MSAFNDLSHRAQVARLRALAERALAHYDLGGPARLSLLLHLANTTFRVDAPGGARYVLRVCQPNYLTAEAIRSEAAWLAALRRDTPLGVPEPVRARDGDLVVVESAEDVPEARGCVLFHFLDGRFARRSIRPVHLERTGALMARLHDHADSFALPEGFTRPRWDADALLGNWLSGNLGPDAGAIPVEDRLAFDRAAPRAHAVIAGLGTEAHFGLIHADLHRSNVLFWNGEARAIDFDDCGFGHHVYDMAVTLWPLAHRQDFSALREALFRGYSRLRPLPPEAGLLIPTFIAARYVVVTNFMLMRAGDNPNLRAWLPGFAAQAARFLRAWLAG